VCQPTANPQRDVPEQDADHRTQHRAIREEQQRITDDRVPATRSTATVKSANAAASLTRLSPVRIAITFLGSPSSRPTATAATASGGATTAPNTSAVANGIDGRTSGLRPQRRTL
jgi:hypothetical protein